MGENIEYGWDAFVMMDLWNNLKGLDYGLVLETKSASGFNPKIENNARNWSWDGFDMYIKD